MSQTSLPALRERALRWLARREYSRAELEQKLRSRPFRAPRTGTRPTEVSLDEGFTTPGDSADFAPDDALLSSAEDIAALLYELEERGLLSDQRFAEARLNHRAQRFGNARMAHELRTKGVDDAIISAVMDTAGDEFARAQAIWQKKFGLVPENRADWAKQARFLQARGFGSDIIRQVLKADAMNAAATTEDPTD